MAGSGIEPRPHWWGESALTTALSLLPGWSPKGVLAVYMTGGGSDGAFYSNPLKVYDPEILQPKKYLGSIFFFNQRD